jgi:tetratricopeptide (TPR) repeat protein
VAEPPSVTFGELLRQLRIDSGLTLEELAARARVAVRTISDLELGKAKSPRESTLSRLAWGLRLEDPVQARLAAVARGRPITDGLRAITTTAPPQTLPRDIASFTGRVPELAQLTAEAAGKGGVVSIYAIGGMAGVGKTTLAVHAAHQLAKRYPDGQVLLPLHGHTPGQRPVAAADALASLLQSVGVDAGQIPSGVGGRARLWRHWLVGKRLLLVLDDAVDSDQVRPLLPGMGESLVLITSRRRLSALEDTHTISLDTLSTAEAGQLFTELVDRPSVTGDDDAVRKITEMCSRLPLAVGMLARQLHHHPAWTLADRAADLAVAHDRLELMRAENLSVAAAFDMSYRDLTPQQQKMFRRLGLHPGSSIDVCAAAALYGADYDTARQHLEALYDHYLLTELAHGRYRFHDLIRQHARTLADMDDPGETAEAVSRLFGYYEYVASRADARLARNTRPAVIAPGERPGAAPVLADGDQALAWLRAERANLLACIAHAAGHAQHARVVALTAGISSLLRTDGPVTEALDLHAAAARAACDLGDGLGEAGAWSEIGTARDLAGDYPAGVEARDKALNLYRDFRNRQGEANVLVEVGASRQLTGDYPGAVQALDRALDISRSLGDRLGQANALRNLGFLLQATGDYSGAFGALDQALGLCRSLGDRQGEAQTLDRLGVVRQLTGDLPGAAEVLECALDIYTGLSHPLGQANALIELGTMRRMTGDFGGAAQALQRALGLYRGLGHQLGEASTLNELGVVQRMTGDLRGAAQAQRQALTISRRLGDPLGEASALNELGVVQRMTGALSAAGSTLERALNIVEKLGHRQAIAEVLNNLGALQLASGQPHHALTRHQHALDLARAVHSPQNEARALEGIGRCAAAAGQAATAATNLAEALKIYQRIGASEAATLAAELDVAE